MYFDRRNFFCYAESDFLQHSEPSYMETSTTEVDPETDERYFYLFKKFINIFHNILAVIFLAIFFTLLKLIFKTLIVFNIILKKAKKRCSYFLYSLQSKFNIPLKYL